MNSNPMHVVMSWYMYLKKTNICSCVLMFGFFRVSVSTNHIYWCIPFSNSHQIFLGQKNCCSSLYLWSNRPNFAMLLHFFFHNIHSKIGHAYTCMAHLNFLPCVKLTRPCMPSGPVLCQKFPSVLTQGVSFRLFRFNSFSTWTHIFDLNSHILWVLFCPFNVWSLVSSTRPVTLQFIDNRNIRWTLRCVYLYVFRCTYNIMLGVPITSCCGKFFFYAFEFISCSNWNQILSRSWIWVD